MALLLSRRLGKKNTWALGMLISGLAFGLLVLAVMLLKPSILIVQAAALGVLVVLLIFNIRKKSSDG